MRNIGKEATKQEFNYFSVISILQKGCHGNGTISPLVQIFGSGIIQFKNPEILRFHLMQDGACSTASLGPSQNLVLAATLICVYVPSLSEAVRRRSVF